MSEITLACTFIVPDGHTAEELRHLAACLVEYVTLPPGDGPLAGDYGPGAWGGYSGPVIVRAHAIARVGAELAAAGLEDWADPA